MPVFLPTPCCPIKLMLSLEMADYHPMNTLFYWKKNPITLFLKHKDSHCHKCTQIGMVNYFSNSLSAGSRGGHPEIFLEGQKVTQVRKIIVLRI